MKKEPVELWLNVKEAMICNKSFSFWSLFVLHLSYSATWADELTQVCS